MKCVLYARVSTGRQAEKQLSIPAQLEAMRSYSRAHELDVVGEFVEPGASAKTTSRPELQRLLARVRSASPCRVDVVLVHKIDRLARNVADHATIRALLLRHGARLASVVEHVDESPSGQLVENIMASIAQFYSGNLSEEVKKGMRQKVLAGGWPHPPPFGYVQVRDDASHGSHVDMHPRAAPLVTDAFRLFASGAYSVKSLARRLFESGWVSKRGGPVAPSHMRQVLSNPFYVGRVRSGGIEAPGRHQPLVDESTFARVQVQLEKRRKERVKSGSLAGFPLRGLAICSSCRGHMTAERHGRYLYYRCSRQAYRRDLCPARFCNAKNAHDDLKRTCLQLQLSRRTADKILKVVKQILGSRAADQATRESELSARDSELLGEMMTVASAFANGSLPPAEHATRQDAIREERKRIQIRLEVMRRGSGETLSAVKQILKLATSLWDMYMPMDDIRRTKLLRLAFETISLGPSGIVGYALTPGLRTLASSQNEGDRHKVAAAVLMNLGAHLDT